jgi:hypothetical protein
MATTPRLRDDLATAFAAARTLLDQGRLDEASGLVAAALGPELAGR